MNLLPGVSGSLFPSRFLLDGSRRLPAFAEADGLEARRGKFLAWWRHAAAECGPVTGLRAIFDLVAMPLAAMLGYRARHALFERQLVRAQLHGPGERSVQLIVLPWAERPSRKWRDLSGDAAYDAPWCVIVGPPFVSVVDLRGQAFRRSMDFRLPDALDTRSFPAFWSLCRAVTLSTSNADALVAEASSFQDCVREDLQHGVIAALGALAPVLGRRDVVTRFGEALTLVYRVLFLLFAESRALTAVHQSRYDASYTVTALCCQALRQNHTTAGLWDGLAAITRLSRRGCETVDLVARPFNGRLFAQSAAPTLEASTGARPTRLSTQRDNALGRALIALGTRPGPAGREAIAYADLGVEQLGAVYERVLDLDAAEIIDAPQAPARRHAHGHSTRRKESGTFYTPQPLAEFVVRRTLSPLVDNASSDDILALRVIDPSMGSGAFLVAACRYLSDAYEHALVSEGRCAETDLDPDTRAGIRRLIAGRCLAGVDANPVAVQLARLSLWLATLAAGKPLGFLDHQLRCGDSLVGASPDDLWRFAPRRSDASPATPLFEAAGLETAIRSIAAPWRRLRDGRDDRVEDVHEKERLWSAIEAGNSPLAPWRAACDLWCARWFWPRSSEPPSSQEFRAVLDAVLHDDRSLHRKTLQALTSHANEIARERRFFHWPLEFADLFYEADGAPKARAGFHAVIGNPPWEMLRGGNHDRRPVVDFVRGSGLYPSCDRGHLNLYQAFVERSLSLLRPGGRVGLVLPWGLAADEGAASLRKRLLQHHRVETIIGLDNSAGLFPIHRGLRFIALVAAASTPRTIHARFGVRTAAELDSLPGSTADDSTAVPIRLDADIIETVGGPSRRFPDARNAEDLRWLVAVSGKWPRLRDGWRIEFGRELNATEDRDSFGSRGLPVIDGKHIAPFRVEIPDDIRRIEPGRAAQKLPSRGYTSARLAYRDVSGVGNRLALIAAMVPAGIVTTHTLFCLRTALPAEQQLFLCALFNSAVHNRIVRMLMGSHVTTGLVENLPVPPWTGDATQVRLAALATALTRTSPDDCVVLRRELDDLVTSMYA